MRGAWLLVLLLAGCAGPAPGSDGPLPLTWATSVEARATAPGRTASEVSIAADPTDGRNLLAAANQDGGFGIHRSSDAATTWHSLFFGPDKFGTGKFRQLSDPAVAFGPDGAAYLAGLAYLPTSAVFVARSLDGGATWDRIALVVESDPATAFNDKEWIGVDPTTGTLVVAWQREYAVDQLRAIDQAAGVDVDFGDILVSRSTDDGRTWSQPLQVSRGRHNNGTQVAFTPDGRGHLLWVNYETLTLDYAASEDQGATWSPPRPIASVRVSGPLPRYDRMHTLPALAASTTGPTLLATWHDARNGDMDVLAAWSADGGGTWSEPVRVHDDPVGNGAHQLYPWAAIHPSGSFHVTFYDARADAHPRFLLYHAWSDGPGHAFRPNRAVSSQPFTAFNARPGESGGEARSFGDYTGLAASPFGVFPAWADGRAATSAIWAARIQRL